VINASLLFLLLLQPTASLTEGRVSGLTVENLERTHATIDRVMAPLSGAKMAVADAALIVEEYRNAAAMLRHACRLGIARLQAEGNDVAAIPAPTRQELAAELEGILAQYRVLWLARNRPGGLPDSAGRLERLLAMYRG
jgi:hypothetical protein